jgi:phage gp36-like protein
MSYATLSDLAARYGADRLTELTDHDADGAMDTGRVEQALADASAEIDGYLAVRYQLPLPTIPKVLRRIACDIAVYRLMSARRMGDVEDDRRRYEDAVRLLTQIAKGGVSLGLPAALPADARPALSLAAAKTGPASVFSEMGGF